MVTMLYVVRGMADEESVIGFLDSQLVEYLTDET